MNPCGDFVSLQNASIAVAILDMVGAIIGILSSSITVLGMLLFRDEVQKILPQYDGFNKTEMGRLMQQPPGMIFGILTFLCIICLLSLYLAAILLIGARRRKILKCSLWWRMKSLLLVVSLLFMIVASVTSPGRLWILIFGTLGLLYQLYCLWIVRNFIYEIRMGKYHRRASSIYSTCEEDIPEDGEEMQKL